MFEQLFKRPHALARHRNGPLAEERRRYLAHCAEQQMSRRTLRRTATYTLIVAKALRLAERLAKEVRDEGYARVSGPGYGAVLRPVLRYAKGRGWCGAGVTAVIMSSRIFPYDSLPAGLSWDDVNRVLTAARGDRPAD